ncbi:TPA: hypothetical protein EYP66_15285 [Candidatus Poribacteria bacterium]|nr:hypothetical protein [Candidatus Poribacteria bacterium]
MIQEDWSCEFEKEGKIMAISTLQENGYLPPGLYLATLDEIWEMFGCTSERRRSVCSSNDKGEEIM